MHVIIIILIVGLLGAGAWDLRDGTLDMLPGNQYGALHVYAEKLPFRVYAPAHVPKGLNFMKKESVNFNQGPNIGIPQFNILYQSSDGSNGMAYRQFDRVRYLSDALQANGFVDFRAYFTKEIKARAVSKNGLEIYVQMSDGKKQTAFGEKKHTGQAYLLREDSLIQVNYYGETALSEDELLKTVASIKSF